MGYFGVEVDGIGRGRGWGVVREAVPAVPSVGLMRVALTYIPLTCQQTRRREKCLSKKWLRMNEACRKRVRCPELQI